MKLKLWTVALVAAAIPMLASAEFYKYVDKQGNVHFTDDLSSVPADQRPSADEYKEVKHPSGPEPSASGKPPGDAKPEPGDAKPEPEEKTESDDTSEVPAEPVLEVENMERLFKELKDTGEALEREYEQLTAERKTLTEAGKKTLTPAERIVLEEQTKDLNARIQDYETRRKAHNKTVETYNAMVSQQQGSPEDARPPQAPAAPGEGAQ